MVRIPKHTDQPRFTEFNRVYIRHVKGQLAGTPVVHEPWQCEDWALALELDPKTGLRVFRDVVMLRPKKNSKSLDAAACGFFMLSPYDGEHGAEGYSLAGSQQQARVVHDVAKTMVDPTSSSHSPHLAALFTKQRDVILGRNDATWRVIAANSDMIEGANAHFASCDEYAVHKTPDLRDNVFSGSLVREQPFMLTISTVGADTTRPLYQLEQNALKLKDVYKPSPYKTIAFDREAGFLFIKYGLAEGEDADLENPDVINGCNPGSWVTPEIVRARLKHPNSREVDVRRKHFNQWVAGGSEGVPAASWHKAEREGLHIPDGAKVVLGVDVGLRDDWSAIVAAALMPDGEVWLEAFMFEPPEGEGQELDLAVIGHTVEQLARRWMVTAVVIDPMFLVDTRQQWQSRGLNVVEFPQYDSRMGPASVSFWQALKSDRLRHGGQSDFTQHVLGAEMKDTARGWRFSKPRQGDAKIDGLVAAVMATHVLLNDDGSSVYQDRGFTRL